MPARLWLRPILETRPQAKLNMPSRAEVKYVLLIVIGHLALLMWALTLIAPPDNIALMWLPNGFLLGCLVLLPRHVWPWVVGMVALTTLGAETWLTDRPVAMIMVFFAANMLESVGGAALFMRFCGGREGITEYRHLVLFLLLCVFALPALTALLGAGAVGYFAGGDDVWRTYRVWYAAAGLGILFGAPLTIELGKRLGHGLSLSRRQHGLHVVLLIALLGSVGLSTLGGRDGAAVYEHLLIVFSLPFLILAALSAGLWGAVSAATLLAIATVQLMAWGFNPGIHAHHSFAENALELQVHLFSAVISSLFIGLTVDKLRRSKAALAESTLRYQAIFDHSPIALLEEDFSAIKRYLDARLAETGIAIDAWFATYPDEVRECSQLARIVSVNSGAGEIFAAKSHKDLLSNLDTLFDDVSLKVFRDELIALYRGDREFRAEAEQMTLSGEKIFTSVRAAVLPGHEDDWVRVIVVLEDISIRMRSQRKLENTLNQLQLAVDSAQLGVWRMDVASGRLDWNAQLLGIHGLRDEQFDNTLDAWRSRVLPEDLAAAEARFEQVMAGSSVFGVQFRIRRPDGEIRYITASGSAITDSAGQLTELVGINQDITDVRRNEERLRQAAAVFSSTAEGVTITELDGTVVDVNEAFTEITGYARDDVIGRTPAILQSGRHDEAFYRGMWQALAETGQWRGEVWNRRKDGTLYPQLLTISAVREEDGEATGYVGVFTDITRIKRSEERLDHLAHHDALTDLPNRLLLNERLGQSIRHATRHQSMLAVVFVDLDRFKTINDSMSHTAGDRLLQQVARRFLASVRAEDTVARLSGDEFILLLEGVGGTEQVTTAVSKLMTVFKAPFDIDAAEVRITASMGVALYPQDGTDAETLLRNADAAMYRAKEEGRNYYHFYTKELTTAAFEHLFLENALRHALDRGQFRLVYQPQIDLMTGRCLGMEALLRWDHPQQGTITPDRFIPIAEQTGLIRAIGLWVLRTACTQAQAWLAQGIEFDYVAVNVAGPQVQDVGFADKVEEILTSSGLPANRLELEVTEGFVMHRAASSIRELHKLRAKGIEIAIDDFGTGYSSLSYLKQLPIDTLKIDQSFVRDVPHDPNDMAISAAVVAMAGELGLKTVAEGVETTAQAHFFRDHGCQLAQGYFFSEPLPAEEIADFFTATAET